MTTTTDSQYRACARFRGCRVVKVTQTWRLQSRNLPLNFLAAYVGICRRTYVTISQVLSLLSFAIELTGNNFKSNTESSNRKTKMYDLGEISNQLFKIIIIHYFKTNVIINMNNFSNFSVRILADQSDTVFSWTKPPNCNYYKDFFSHYFSLLFPSYYSKAKYRIESYIDTSFHLDQKVCSYICPLTLYSPQARGKLWTLWNR